MEYHAALHIHNIYLRMLSALCLPAATDLPSLTVPTHDLVTVVVYGEVIMTRSTHVAKGTNSPVGLFDRPLSLPPPTRPAPRPRTAPPAIMPCRSGSSSITRSSIASQLPRLTVGQKLLALMIAQFVLHIYCPVHIHTGRFFGPIDTSIWNEVCRDGGVSPGKWCRRLSEHNSQTHLSERSEINCPYSRLRSSRALAHIKMIRSAGA